MADIVKNPPKDETTPGQNIESRKTGNKKVVEELQEFNTKTKEIAEDAKTGFRAIVEGIKEGNAEMAPAVKAQISGFKELSDAQQNVVDIFGDMKSGADKSQAAMAKDMSVEKGSKLEAAQEQFGLWERMLLRLVGIDEDLDQLIENTMPVKEKGSSWLGLLLMGGLIGAITGLVAGIAFGFVEVLLLYAKLLIRFFRFVGGKFINSKMMKPIVEPIRRFFTSIGKNIAKIGKSTRSSLIAPIANFFKDIIRQFKAGFKGSKGAVASSKGFAKQGMFAKIGKIFGDIGKTFTKIWAPIKAFNKQTAALWKSTAAVSKTAKASTTMFGGFFKGFRGFFRLLGLVFKPMWAGFKLGIKVFAPIGRIFGRLFLPLTIIMGLVDGIRGFIDGFKNTEGNMFSKIIGGLIGGVKGIINGLIMMPLDMLKNAVAWLLGKFGFDGLSESLKSFSFQEMYSKFVDMFTDTLWAVVDWFKLLFSDPGQALKNLVTGMANIIMNFYKAILRFILPDPKGGKWYNPLSLIQKVIPDSVYTWAGLDPDTGERLPEPGEMGPPVPEGDLDPTADTMSTMSKWGQNIKGWWNSNKGRNIGEDPITGLMPVGQMGPPNPNGAPLVVVGGSSSSQENVSISVVGGGLGGQETKQAVGGGGPGT